MLEDPLLQNIPWAILLLPLAGFISLALFGDAIRREKNETGAGLMACGTVLVSFALAVWSTLRLETLLADPDGLRFFQPALGQPLSTGGLEFSWIEVGGFSIPFSLLVDRLSMLMTLVVTGVGSLIHIYSLGYMSHDEDRVRYFSYLNLFTFFMLMLVLAGNLPLLFVGWEGVGLCSYLLIGFWYRKKSASDAGMKAFIVNRIGDAGLILGMVLTFHGLGSLDLVDIITNASSKPPEAFGQFGLLTGIALLLFVGACGKSAQVPLHVWLPDAMEGPTPVSALIHAATMVTAGVYLVARLAPLFALSETAMIVVATVGAVTALLAAGIALVQTDIKKVLAYSTVSQLGYMFLACGVGAFGVAVFHLFTHAFFKALLFLAAGSVIHALSGEQDMRRMGGLRKRIPWTYSTFLVGTLAIAGIPPLAGFFSKDAILAGALQAHLPLLFGIGLFTALLTSFYMARLLFLTFFGDYRGDDADGIHESPLSMLAPLVLLAVGAAFAGLIDVPALLAPVIRVPGLEGHQAWLPYAATVVALAGIVGAYYMYLVFTDTPGRVSAAARPLHRALEEKYGFDRAYDWIASRLVVDGSRAALWKGVDVGLIDAAVDGIGRLTGDVSARSRLAQTGYVRGYLLVTLAGAVALLGYLVWVR